MTPSSGFIKAARNATVGSRNLPQLRNIPCMPHAPVLHCTGVVAQSIVVFGLSLVTITSRDAARLNIDKVMDRSSMGGMYLREFGRLVSHNVALPRGFGVRIDGAGLVKLALSDLFTASSRRAASKAAPDVRECAVTIVRLAASLLGPLYEALKPFDPETKTAEVFNLYLHTAIARVGSTLGKAFPTARHICNDQIEGRIAELNKHFRTRTNNVSRGESLVKNEATQPMQFAPAQGRTAVEIMTYTE